jgi:hypothetical protein
MLLNGDGSSPRCFAVSICDTAGLLSSSWIVLTSSILSASFSSMPCLFFIWKWLLQNCDTCFQHREIYTNNFLHMQRWIHCVVYQADKSLAVQKLGCAKEFPWVLHRYLEHVEKLMCLSKMLVNF